MTKTHILKDDQQIKYNQIHKYMSSKILKLSQTKSASCAKLIHMGIIYIMFYITKITNIYKYLSKCVMIN